MEELLKELKELNSKNLKKDGKPRADAKEADLEVDTDADADTDTDVDAYPTAAEINSLIKRVSDLETLLEQQGIKVTSRYLSARGQV